MTDSTPLPNRKAEHSAETQRRLIEVARQIFAERGFTGTGTEGLVAAAHMTRGALYHHYDDKRDLFRTVSAAVAREFNDIILRAAAAERDPWKAMRAGTRAFLQACRDPAFRQIVIVDGPSVLGTEEWRRLNGEYAYATVHAALEANVAAGNLPRQPLEPLAHVYVGALYEAGRHVAEAPDPEAAVEVYAAVVNRIMEAQRLRPVNRSRRPRPTATPPITRRSGRRRAPLRRR